MFILTCNNPILTNINRFPRGFGFIAWDSNVMFLQRPLDPVLVLSPLLAEALRFRWALSLSLAAILFKRAIFETDCLLFFRLWKSRGEGGGGFLSLFGAS